MSPEGPKARANMIFVLTFVENCFLYNAIHGYTEWLRTSSNPADINRFQSSDKAYSK